MGTYLSFAIFSQFIEEAERSLHDAIMIVRRAMKNSTVVAGGGAIDVCLHSEFCCAFHWIMIGTVKY
jgi:chaperonin GroEL (HSP60 family)